MQVGQKITIRDTYGAEIEVEITAIEDDRIHFLAPGLHGSVTADEVVAVKSGRTTVIAERAPIGVQLWPTVSPECAPNFTLASVTRTATSVIWTYENGSTRHFLPGDEISVRFA